MRVKAYTPIAFALILITLVSCCYVIGHYKNVPSQMSAYFVFVTLLYSTLYFGVYLHKQDQADIDEFEKLQKSVTSEASYRSDPVIRAAFTLLKPDHWD